MGDSALAPLAVGSPERRRQRAPAQDGNTDQFRAGGGRATKQRRAPQDGRTPVLRFRALLTESGVERVELARA
jgi:hypothetical protein